jgi:predicted AAA+ superfamily ATPase
MYVERNILSLLKTSLEHFQAVLLTGPRQSGKTTFLRHQLGDIAEYVTFDDPMERMFAKEDPNAFLDRFERKSVILDEIQYAPHLFSYIKIRIDEDRFNGCEDRKWIMTGSQQFQLMRNISDSLAGRVAVLELLPFDFTERQIVSEEVPLSKQIWVGGYPENVLHPAKRDLWVKSYIATYLERDVRQLNNVIDLGKFHSFIALCASIHGQELNYTKLASRCGISVPTCKEWLSVLEASYIIFLLQPFYENFGKRVIKSPKLYFLDSSLVATLTRQPTPDALISGAMSEAFFEGFIISETYKTLSSRGSKPELYFWRSHDGVEIDLLLIREDELLPVEIKCTQTPSSKHAVGLEKFSSFVKDSKKISRKIIVCNVKKSYFIAKITKAVNWQEFLLEL